MWSCALPCARVCTIGKEEWVSSRGTRSRTTEMLIYVISTYTFKLQGTISKNSLSWLLAANSFLLCVLWKTIKPVAVALSPAVNCRNSCSIETECTSYLPCENVWCESFLGTECAPSYRLCMHTVFSFVPSEWVRVVSKGRQSVSQPCSVSAVCCCSAGLLACCLSLEDDKS